ncbi:hypothetical protein KJ365_13655 [Glaciecola sp. XM2]|jgi:predicted RNA-binding protein (virulence factor B family)|uniref:CvfB family protein n=1 Tax=Glaciecola sp. XM2 TaxID=1914931 RepID=UPI001BDEACAF|nr:S1-like domain-containing RNA-binding protein [Glaciecola sp. XM2]MBT1451933.1 hypothetical protein [Glaciecola sp. XM2]
MLNIGTLNTLTVIEATPMGYLLSDGDSHHEHDILLTTEDQSLAEGQSIDVFLYYGQDRNIHATLTKPAITVDEFKALRVVGLSDAGAFFDWGLPKDLYAPKQHTHSELAIGMPAVVKLVVEDKQHKLYATTKIEKFLSPAPDTWSTSTPVQLLVYAKTPLGFKVIIDDTYAGLLYHSDLFKPVHIGEVHQGFIKRIREDGKVDVTLQRHDKKQRASLAEQILDDLEAHGGLSSLTDKSSPQDIQVRFNVSKASYKKALGQLYKEKKIVITPKHIKLTNENS